MVVVIGGAVLMCDPHELNRWVGPMSIVDLQRVLYKLEVILIT